MTFFIVPPRGAPEVYCNAHQLRACPNFRAEFIIAKFPSNGQPRGQPRGRRNTHMDTVVHVCAPGQLLGRIIWRGGRILPSLKPGQMPSCVHGARLARAPSRGEYLADHRPLLLATRWPLTTALPHSERTRRSRTIGTAAHFYCTSTGTPAVLLYFTILVLALQPYYYGY